jgi:hypothetical protein
MFGMPPPLDSIVSGWIVSIALGRTEKFKRYSLFSI